MSLKVYIKRGVQYLLHGQPVYNTNVSVKTLEPSAQLRNRCILITGGSRGIGYYIAKKCVAEGAHVVITGRSEETLKKASAEIGEGCKYLVFDSTRINDFQILFNNAENLLSGSRLDSVVCNAGISLHEGDFRNVSEENWDMQMDTNLKSNYFMVKEFVKYIESNNLSGGNIILITSERGNRPDDIPYGLTKTAVSSFVKAIASKVITKNIRINAVAPGVTATDMTGFSKDGNLYNGWQNSRRIYLPEEVAEVANFLLSDASACISGEIINCDQGNYIVHW